MKEREEKNSGRKKKVRKKSRTTEFSITIVLCCLVAVLTVKGISLQQKVNANASRLSSLDTIKLYQSTISTEGRFIFTTNRKKWRNVP